MIDKSDTQTVDLFQPVRRRGRPSTGCAKPAAQRMREYRARLRAMGKSRVTESSTPDLSPVVADLGQQLLAVLDRELSACVKAVAGLRAGHASLKVIQKKRNEAKALRDKISALKLIGGVV